MTHNPVALSTFRDCQSAIFDISDSSAKKEINTIKESSKLEIDSEEISIPEEITFTTTENATAYGYFYKPKNKKY